MDIEMKLREILLPVFALGSVDQIPPEASLVEDIGADSIDFVEIVYLIEQHFGVVLKISEVLVGGRLHDPDELFAEGELTAEGAEILNGAFPGAHGRFRAGLTRMALFSLLTVRDLAGIITAKLPEAGHAVG